MFCRFLLKQSVEFILSAQMCTVSSDQLDFSAIAPICYALCQSRGSEIPLVDQCSIITFLFLFAIPKVWSRPARYINQYANKYGIVCFCLHIVVFNYSSRCDFSLLFPVEKLVLDSSKYDNVHVITQTNKECLRPFLGHFPRACHFGQ